MIQQKLIYLVRHGETEWNAMKKFQGHTDIPLNDEGRKQAESLIDLMAEINPEIVLSSDLSRAIETAKIACQKIGKEVQIHSDLRETNLGQAEGMFRDDLFAQHGEESLKKWFSIAIEDCDFSFPDGETKMECVKRVKGFLESWLVQVPEEKIVIFSHGGVIRNMVHSSLNAPTEPVMIHNCACQLVSYHPAEVQRWRYVRQIV